MIELPEAVVLAEQVTSTLQGKRIARATANHSPHRFAWYTGDPAGYNDRLAGKTVGPARASGCYVEIEAGDMLLVDCQRGLPGRQHLLLRRLPAPVSPAAPVCRTTTLIGGDFTSSAAPTPPGASLLGEHIVGDGTPGSDSAS
jgi:hypothetical protein